MLDFMKNTDALLYDERELNAMSKAMEYYENHKEEIEKNVLEREEGKQ